jgi:hypothetical protein
MVLSTGVPDMTVDSIRNWTPRRRASAVNSTAAAAQAPLRKAHASHTWSAPDKGRDDWSG